WFSIPFFGTQYLFIGTIFILWPEQEPFFFAKVIICIRIERRGNNHKRIPSAVTYIQDFLDVVISHKESTPSKGKATLSAKRELKKGFPGILVGITERSREIIGQGWRTTDTSGFTTDDFIACCYTFVPHRGSHEIFCV